MRGELGFINSTSARMPNRNFLGTSGHPSKKGVYGLSQTSRFNPMDAQTDDAPVVSNVNGSCVIKPEIGSDSMISKRTEWLEGQERRMTATMSDTRSMAVQMRDALSRTEAELEALKNVQEEKSQMLYNEIHSVLGHIPTKRMLIVKANSDKALDTLEGGVEVVSIDCEYVQLVYPMKTVRVGESTKQLMRCKQVDPVTGQLSFCWIVVYEEENGTYIRHVSRFTSVTK